MDSILAYKLFVMMIGKKSGADIYKRHPDSAGCFFNHNAVHFLIAIYCFDAAEPFQHVFRAHAGSLRYVFEISCGDDWRKIQREHLFPERLRLFEKLRINLFKESGRGFAEVLFIRSFRYALPVKIAVVSADLYEHGVT